MASAKQLSLVDCATQPKSVGHQGRLENSRELNSCTRSQYLDMNASSEIRSLRQKAGSTPSWIKRQQERCD